VLSRIAVVVPAHDEEELLPGCLAALARAVRRAPAGVSVEIVVVADDCADRTERVALAAGARTVVVAARNVGGARAAGLAYALRHGPDGLWLATTDADSRVPAGWLRRHASQAAAGAELLAGTVTVVDWTPRPARVRARYESLYRAGSTATAHRHVHGANLGCDAPAYLALGGFAPLATGEDRDLVRRAHRAGRRVVYDLRLPVVTSARRTGRAPAGFADHLDTLDNLDTPDRFAGGSNHPIEEVFTVRHSGKFEARGDQDASTQGHAVDAEALAEEGAGHVRRDARLRGRPVRRG
jgi:glycosyltransferase involved in cell wall biosynthesis